MVLKVNYDSLPVDYRQIYDETTQENFHKSIPEIFNDLFLIINERIPF